MVGMEQKRQWQPRHWRFFMTGLIIRNGGRHGNTPPPPRHGPANDRLLPQSAPRLRFI
jgi:hypothetical protein